MALALACGVAEAQTPRPAARVDLDTQVSATDACAASEGELTLVAYRHDGEVAVVRSLDAGLSFSSPIRVDGDGTLSLKWMATDSGGPPLAITNGVAHLVWRDARNGADDLWYARSLDGGLTWQPETRLDKGFPTGSAPVREYVFAADGPHVYVLFTVDPGGAAGFLPDELAFVSSHDGGATWSSARFVSSVAFYGADVDALALAVDGADLWIAWSDDRFGVSTQDDLWLLSSTDRGTTFAGIERQIDPSGPLDGDVENEIALAAEGGLVALAWQEEFGSVREEAWAALSRDGGASFPSALRVGSYDPNVTDVDAVTLALHEGVAYVAWDDDRSGVDEAHLVTTADAGVTWSADLTLSSGGGGDVRFLGGDDLVVAIWSGDPSSPGRDRALARISRDGGATWGASVHLSSNSGDIDAPRCAWNARYGNVVATWLADDTGTNAVWAGGFRPQTLTPVGWTSGAAARLDFSGFRPGTRFAWAFASDAPGALRLPLGDGRNLGLTPDATFLVTLTNPLVFSAPLDASGAGATPSSIVPLPPGTRLYAAAVGFRLAPLAFDELTDVFAIDVP